MKYTITTIILAGFLFSPVSYAGSSLEKEIDSAKSKEQKYHTEAENINQGAEKFEHGEREVEQGTSDMNAGAKEMKN